MIILDSSIAEGNVSALILAEAADTAGYDTPQQAVEATIRKFLDENGIGQVMYTRVLEMNPGIDSTVRFSFETAAVPEVTLGQYKGLKINAAFDSNPEDLALAAAAENTAVKIPFLVVDRKLDTMILEKKAGILESSSINALTDMYAILCRLNDQSGAAKSENEVWELAANAAVRYTESGAMEMSDFIGSIRSVFPSEEETVAELVNQRIYERRSTPADDLAAQVFESYLRISGMTEESWRDQNAEAAAKACRIDFLLNAVADKENISVSDEEYKAAVRAMSMQYQMPMDTIMEVVPRPSVEYQIRMDKARKLITDSAIQS